VKRRELKRGKKGEIQNRETKKRRDFSPSTTRLVKNPKEESSGKGKSMALVARTARARKK